MRVANPSQTNRYISSVSPWAIAKYANDMDLLRIVIYLLAESLRLTAILLQPFIPESASRLLDMLGVQQDRRTHDFAQLGADYEYGIPATDLGRGVDTSLFPPLIGED